MTSKIPQNAPVADSDLAVVELASLRSPLVYLVPAREATVS